ncbi:MAG: type VI secretion system tip protein VgrG [Planctomycetes bacterium]|nr:type VI secretion system tip protein VgrG [Planctomycetota bacterium]
MVDASRRAYQLHSGAVEDGTLQIAAFHGVERMSTLFRFEFDLMSAQADLDGEAILAADARLGIKQPTVLASGKRGVQMLLLHGVLASFEQHGRTDDGVRYRAVLMPRLWRLSLTSQSRIFQDLTVAEIVEQVLKDHGFEPEDFEFRAKGRTYPKREYVVQYRENDLAFISRLLEHEGIFFSFEHGEKRSVVVFGDQPENCTKVTGAASFIYRTHVGGTRAEDAVVEESVTELTVLHRPVTGQVVLGDYNYRTPDAPMYPTAEVSSPAAFGHQYEYGDHFKDEDEGKALATVRSQEIACRKRQFRGVGDARGFRAGGVFTLAEHYRADVNIDHLLIEVKHQGSQAFATADEDEDPSAIYINDFITIPASVVFRPKRVTPKPVVHGTITAKVDAAGDGQYSELDDQGRYKLKFPFDRSDLKDGKASRFVRMAQPYAGDDMGMHFPLHKDTEVIVTHINGDPDRPLIAAAVPNPKTSSKVKGENQSQSMIRSGGGNSIQMEDSAGAEGFNLNATYGYSLTVGNDASVSVGNNASESVAVDKTSTVGSNDTQDVGSNRTVTIGADSSETVGANQTLSIGANRTENVGANRTSDVGANDSLNVGANLAINVASNCVLSAGAKAAIGAPQIILDGGSAVKISVGGSSITIDASGITIDAPKITIKGGAAVEIGAATIKVAADAACEIGGAMIDVKASGPLALKGAMITNNS